MATVSECQARSQTPVSRDACTQASSRAPDAVLIFLWFLPLEATHSLQALRVILSTGSPLKAQSYEYVYKWIKSSILLGSMSGVAAQCWPGGGQFCRTRGGGHDQAGPWLGGTPTGSIAREGGSDGQSIVSVNLSLDFQCDHERSFI